MDLLIIREIKNKNVSLLKMSMLVQIVAEILSLLCSNDSIQILLKMVWFLMLIVLGHQSITVAISHH